MMDSHGAVNIQTNERRKKSLVFGNWIFLKTKSKLLSLQETILYVAVGLHRTTVFIEMNGCAKALYFHSASVSYVGNLVTRKPD